MDYGVGREAGENVGSYFETVTVGDNANYAIIPVAGRFTITPASTTGNEDASVTTNSEKITYGDTTPAFSLTVGKDLTTTGAGLTNADFDIINPKYTNDGKYLAAGTYAVKLNQSGIDKLAGVNPNYTIDSFTDGTITVAQKQIKVTADSQNKVYGTKDPTLTADYDKSQLVGTDSLDYGVGREAGENVGSYFETVTVGDNANYAIIPVAGRFTITPAATTPGDTATEVSTNNQGITYGDATPSFTVKGGTDVKIPADLTNKDFSFVVKNADGTTSAYTGAVDADGVPTDKGTYVVNLNESGQAKVQAVNGNYTLSADDFIAGTYTIAPKATTPSDATTKVTTNNQHITYGQGTPVFTATPGSAIKLPTLTNSDFVFTNADGSALANTVKVDADGVPTDKGSYKVTLSDAAKTAIEDLNPNYTMSDSDFIAGTYTIDAKATTPTDATTQVTTGNQEITYGDATPAFTAMVSKDSQLDLSKVTFTNDDFDFYSADGKTKLDGIPTNKGTYQVNLNAAGQAKVQAANTNYTLTSGDFIAGTYTINPKSATTGEVTIGDAKGEALNKTYDGSTFSGNPVFQGPEKDVTLTTGDYEYVDANGKVVANPVNAGDYKVELTQAGIDKVTAANSDYDLGDLTALTSNATIAKAKATLTVTSNDDITYDGKAHHLNVAVDGAVNGETITYTTTNNDQTAVGHYDVTVKADANNVNSNYDITTNQGSMTIVKAATTPGEVTIGDAKGEALNKTYDGSTFSGNPVFQGPEQDVTLTTGDYEYVDANGKVVTNPVNAGDYKVKLTTAGIEKVTAANSDYDLGDLTALTSNATIAKAKATLTVTSNDDITYDGKAHHLDVAVSGAVNGETITYTTANNDQTVVGQYDVTVKADANNVNSNYDITTNQGSMTIVKAATTPGDAATQTTIGNEKVTYGDATPNFTIGLGSALKQVTYTNADLVFSQNGKDLAGAPVNAGTYQVRLSDAAKNAIKAANPNYDFAATDFGTAEYVIAKKPITLTADNQQKVFGEKDPSLTATVGAGLIAGDSLAYTVSRESGENVGSYATSIEVGANANYTVVPIAGKFTITQKATTPNDEATQVTVNNQTIKEGDGTPTFTVSFGNHLVQVPVSNADFVFTQNGQVLTGIPTKAGTYSVTLSAAAQQRIIAEQNYALTISDFITGTFVIQPATTNPGGGNNVNPGGGNETNPGGGNNVNPGGGNETNPGGGNNVNPGNGNQTNPGGNNNSGNGGQTSPGNGVNNGATGNGTGATSGNTGATSTGTTGNNGNQTTTVATASKAASKPTVNLKAAAVTDKSKLPQTNEASGNVVATAGLALLSGLFGLIGIRRKKHEDKD
ncbi:hypothetical protein BSQ39_11670 [Loigolactobacillus backii]|nr:hypothetical protein BSQ39_11670 [Loigolactobacillus backii]